MVMKTRAEWIADIEASKKSIREELGGMDASQLKEYARKRYIKGITFSNLEKARDSIAQIVVNREFKGWAFRCTD